MLTRAGADTAWAQVLESVRRECVEADGQEPLDEAALLRLKHRGLEGSELWLAEDAGAGAGFALRHDGGVDLAVAPSARGHGLGGELARASLPSGAVTAWSHGDHPGAAALARRHGLRRARELWVMRRSASESVRELVVPNGVTVRGYRRDDEAEVLRVNAAAFAHHPEQGSMDANDLAGRMAEDWFDAGGLLVADTGSGLSGFHWTKQHSAELGEVYVVAIDPAAQGRGLGKVLTLAGLVHLRDAGVNEVLLYVESDNAPAVGVYAGLGFRHADRDTHVQYQRP